MSLLHFIDGALNEVSKLESVNGFIANNERYNYCLKKLEDLADLQDGWYSGKGKKPNALSIAIAKMALSNASLRNLWRSNVFPLTDGGIMVLIDAPGHSIEISAGNNGNIEYEHRNEKIEVSYSDELKADQLADWLERSAKSIWLSESLVHNTMMKSGKSLLASLSNHQKKTQASQSSRMLAPFQRPAQSVNTPQPITGTGQAIRQYFGNLTNQNCRGTQWYDSQTTATASPQIPATL